MADGMATAQFRGIYPNAILPDSKQVHWPFLNQLLSLGILEKIDLAIAEFLLKNKSNPSDDLAAFLCHLNSSVRAGYICVQIDDNKITPSPIETWKFDPANISLNESLLNQLEAAICRGALVAKTLTEGEHPSLYQESNSTYFNRQWSFKMAFQHEHEVLLNQPASPSLDDTIVKKLLEEAITSKKLLPEQAAAVSSGCFNRLTLIAGGPGTGKTYTAGHLINMVLKALPENEKAHFHISLAAPTGKAAANLYHSIQKATAELASSCDLHATTLHRLLGIRNLKPKQGLLPADLLLIDESSMIDLELMVHLFKAIKPNARLILLGDPHQLPAIAPGTPFSDMVTQFKNKNLSNLVELNICRRTDLQSIISLAQMIKSNQLGDAYRLLNSGIPGISLTPLYESIGQLHQQLLTHAYPFFAQMQHETNPEQILKAMQQFRILSPIRQGPYGVEALNQLFYTQLARSKQLASMPKFIPIMITKNDPKLDLSNGETGVLVHGKNRNLEFSKKGMDPSQSGDLAFFIDKQTGQLKKIPALLLPTFEYAFCISVHKSQGSEFDHVLLLIPPGNHSIRPEMLYTAVTRAKQKLEIWAKKEAFH